MAYTPTTDSRIDHYRREAIAHLEANEIYYGLVSLKIAIQIYEDALKEDNAE